MAVILEFLVVFRVPKLSLLFEIGLLLNVKWTFLFMLGNELPAQVDVPITRLPVQC